MRKKLQLYLVVVMFIGACKGSMQSTSSKPEKVNNETLGELVCTAEIKRPNAETPQKLNVYSKARTDLIYEGPLKEVKGRSDINEDDKLLAKVTVNDDKYNFHLSNGRTVETELQPSYLISGDLSTIVVYGDRSVMDYSLKSDLQFYQNGEHKKTYRSLPFCRLKISDNGYLVSVQADYKSDGGTLILYTPKGEQNWSKTVGKHVRIFNVSRNGRYVSYIEHGETEEDSVKLHLVDGKGNLIFKETFKTVYGTYYSRSGNFLIVESSAGSVAIDIKNKKRVWNAYSMTSQFVNKGFCFDEANDLVYNIEVKSINSSNEPLRVYIKVRDVNSGKILSSFQLPGTHSLKYRYGRFTGFKQGENGSILFSSNTNVFNIKYVDYE